MPKIRILNGHHGMTSEKSARRMVDRGVARWNDSHTAIRLIEQDFRVKPSARRAGYSAGYLGRATIHEMKRIPIVMPERMLSKV